MWLKESVSENLMKPHFYINSAKKIIWKLCILHNNLYVKGSISIWSAQI